MSYKDMTWCDAATCGKKDSCPRYYSKGAHEDACRWWGGPDPRVMFYIEPAIHLECYLPAVKEIH
jgi:hypothetical protein